MNQLSEKQLEILQKYPKEIQEKVLSSVRPHIRLELVPKENLPLITSKIGGFGYFPKNKNYPVNENGPLWLLAQINFAEFEHLEDFPSSGLLAIYVDITDVLFGTDTESGYQVFYFENLSEESYSFEEQQLLREQSKGKEDPMSPVEKECQIVGKVTLAHPSLRSLEFDELFDYYRDQEEHDKGCELTSELDVVYPNHTIGGFPEVFSEDPRFYEPNHDTLLLQLASEWNSQTFEDYIVWGDSGAGNFFINREKLKKKDFSDIFFYFDCC